MIFLNNKPAFDTTQNVTIKIAADVKDKSSKKVFKKQQSKKNNLRRCLLLTRPFYVNSPDKDPDINVNLVLTSKSLKIGKKDK